MRTTIVLVALAGISGCVESAPPAAYPQFQPQFVQGPPGGEIDPDSAYVGQQPGVDGDSGTVGDDYVTGACPQGMAVTDDPAYSDGTASGTPGCKVAGDPTAAVTDAEIDMTLDGRGEWLEDSDYGSVWRPDPTVVGANFTPYETCGSWVYTDAGWTYQCDWDWGWLPFHYGQWDWFDDSYWVWVPGNQYSPAWVDWRNGNNVVGWRPTSPIRDHRPGHHGTPSPQTGPTIRDHRHGPSRDVHWSFVGIADLGKHNVHAHVTHDLAQGLATTQPGRPNVRGGVVVRNDFVMHGRYATNNRNHDNVRNSDNRDRGERDPKKPSVTVGVGVGMGGGGYWRPTGGNWRPQRPYTPQQPAQPAIAPGRDTGGPVFHGNDPTPPRPNYQPPPVVPVRTYQPPAATRQPPIRVPDVHTYHPSQPPPPPVVHHYEPARVPAQPSRSYDPPSRSEPSHSSNNDSSGGGRSGSSGGGPRHH